MTNVANQVGLIGRLVRDPELTYTAQNRAVAKFTIAVTRNYKDSSGEREADFIPCVLWNKRAENLASWGKKGNLISVAGSMRVRNYVNKDNQKVYITEVVAEDFQLFERRGTNAREQSMSEPQGNDYQEPANTPSYDNPAMEDLLISDDDELPF